jgi:hypothetical protein
VLICGVCYGEDETVVVMVAEEQEEEPQAEAA